MAKHTALSNLDQDPLNYLLQSWDEVRRISDAGADLDRFSDVHILSAKYHLIGEEHSLQANADFLKAVQDWRWGARHLSERLARPVAFCRCISRTNNRIRGWTIRLRSM